MAEIFNLPTKEQFDMQNAILASIASHVGTEGIKISSWKDVQRIVRMGLADKVFAVGDQFVSSYGTDSEIVWDVIGIDHDIPTDKKYTHSLTIQAHDCILNAQYSASQALYYAEEELSAGEHIFTQDNGPKYKFTTTQPIPAGGQIYITSWSDPYIPLKAATYAADRVTAIEENLDVVEVSEGENTLLDVNVRARCRYGSNNYVESAVRQWLNSSEASFAWVPQTNYDRPSTGDPYNGAGFLSLLDPELVAVIGEADKQVARNTVTDDGGQDLFSDKVFLLSRAEVYGDTEGDTTGEKPYPYYVAFASSPVSGKLAGRIKLLNGSPRYWWLRSPDVGGACGVRGVGTSGIVYYSSAPNARGLAPACVII